MKAIEKIHAFLSIPMESKYAILITVGIFVLVKVLLIFLPVRKVLNLSMKLINLPVTNDRIILLKEAIKIVATHIPWKSTCLDKALTGKYLYDLYNIPTQLYLGLRKNGDTFEAHAWLKYNDYFITEAFDEGSYTTIATF